MFKKALSKVRDYERYSPSPSPRPSSSLISSPRLSSKEKKTAPRNTPGSVQELTGSEGSEEQSHSPRVSGGGGDTLSALPPPSSQPRKRSLLTRSFSKNKEVFFSLSAFPSTLSLVIDCVYTYFILHSLSPLLSSPLFLILVSRPSPLLLPHLPITPTWNPYPPPR